MRQGRASRDVTEGYKPKTNPRGISVTSVSQIGESLGDHITEKSKILTGVAKDLYNGRGFYSPLGAPGTPGVGRGGRTVYNKGSQGKR